MLWQYHIQMKARTIRKFECSAAARFGLVVQISVVELYAVGGKLNQHACSHGQLHKQDASQADMGARQNQPDHF
jgi:hypothetical protein